MEVLKQTQMKADFFIKFDQLQRMLYGFAKEAPYNCCPSAETIEDVCDSSSLARHKSPLIKRVRKQQVMERSGAAETASLITPHRVAIVTQIEYGIMVRRRG